MDTRFLGLDNILEALGINSSKAFQLVYNEALAGRETTGLNITGCEWAPAQLDFSYEWLEASGRIKAMATYVDADSEPVARGKNVQLAKVSGTIPRQKRKILRGEDDYRKELIALNNADAMARLRGESPYSSVRQYLAQNLFDTLAEIPDSHNASLSYARGQMFGKRELSLTADNNPSGLTMTFKSEVPDANVDTTNFYNVDGSGNVTYVETVDPIQVWKKKIWDLKSDLYNGYTNIAMEMTYKTFYILMEHPKVLQRLGYNGNIELQILAGDTAGAAAAQKVGYDRFLSSGDEALKNWFKLAVGIDELIIDTTIVGVDKLNATTKRFDTEKINAFPDGTVLIRPTGNVAQIFNVTPLRPDSSAISATIFGGRGIIEYFYDPRHRTQTWISELTVLPVPTRPKDMYYYECGKHAPITKLSVANGNGVAVATTSTKKTETTAK